MREGYCSCLVCVCVSVHGSNLLVAQLRDKLVILTGSIVVALEIIRRFSNNGFVSKIAIAFPYLRALVISRVRKTSTRMCNGYLALELQ